VKVRQLIVITLQSTVLFTSACGQFEAPVSKAHAAILVAQEVSKTEISEIQQSNSISVTYRPKGNFVVIGPRSSEFHERMGTTSVDVPVVDKVKEGSSCHLACYSHNEQALYPVGGNIYVNGLVKVSGRYSGRICLPSGAEDQDISAMQSFKDLCEKKVLSCAQGDCWAGGDTGGFFGHH
jgi:hypothetical protein